MADTNTTIQTFDVIATSIQTGLRRVMASGELEGDAEAFIAMAVVRRGVDVEFYSVVPFGSVADALFADEAEQEFAQRLHRDFDREATTNG